VNRCDFLRVVGVWLCLPVAFATTSSAAIVAGGEFDLSNPVGIRDLSDGKERLGSSDERVWRRLHDAAEAAGNRLASHIPAVRRFVAALDELEKARIEDVHYWLHARILTGAYRESLYDVATTLESGDYNCVTAAILFKIACERSGIAVRFVATAQHVSCRESDGRWIEPTCADWFRDGRQAAMLDPSRRESRPARDIGWQGLLARVCYNRGVARLAAGDFPGATSDFASACGRDDGFREAFENQLAALNNWALACCAERKFSEAVARLQAARTLDADNPLLRANELHVDHQWSMWLCESGEYGEALALLEAGRARQPQAELYRCGPPAIARQWLEELNRQPSSPQNGRIRDDLTARYPDAASATESHANSARSRQAP